MIDVEPEDFIAGRINTTNKSIWVHIPGKHKTRDAAWDALDAMLATRH
jgi:hypothetical protein